MPKAVLQSCCPKAADSCSPKLLPKIAPQTCVLKATPQRCSPKLRFFKAAVESCSSKVLPKAAPQSCSPALLHKVVPKAVLQSCCPKAAILRTCLPKRLPEVVCKTSPGCSSKRLFLKVAPDSLPKLLPKAAVQSYCPKAAILQIYTLKPLPKAILQSGSRKLLLKAAPRSGLCTGRS